MDLCLRGRAVLVTGATGGIGAAIARAFAAEGARVAIGYRTNAAAARELAEELPGAWPVPYDLEPPDGPAETVEAVRDRFGGLDVLVTAAVTRTPRRDTGTSFEDVPVADWEPALLANLGGTIRTVQPSLALMRKQGWGRIVLLSSHVERNGRRGQECYAAGKAALHGFVRSLACEIGPDNVLANVVAPGLTLTDGVRAAMPERVVAAETALTPSGRLSRPEDVANAVVFLGSDANANITGSVLTVSGGR
jgi:3-oxoacyl-[acyl-carrier protein] reductase